MKTTHLLSALALSLVALALPRLADAQTTVQVGTQTNLTDNGPVKTTENYHYSQSIYTKTDINTGGGSGPGNISKIRFFYESGGYTNSTNWTIYLGHTNKTSFLSDTDWFTAVTMVNCFSGNVTFPTAGNWIEITLTTPFLWNGSDNLVVGVDENAAGLSATAAFWRFTNYTESLILRYGSTTANPSKSLPTTGAWRGTWAPNIQFVWTSAPPTAHCSPSTSNSSNNFNDHHENFTTTGGIGNITDTDNLGSSPGYKNKYASLSAQQIVGGFLGFSVKSFGTNVKFKIWVDWNSNNVFDATEEMFYGQGSSNPIFNGSFTIPSVPPGDYRMRIRSEGGSAAAVIPCGVIAWGEARDYKITVTTPTAFPTFSTWHKADENVTLSGSQVSSWASVANPYLLAQASTGQRPTLVNGSNQYKLFNYNKRIKFTKANSTRLENINPPVSGDPLGSDGTVFLIVNNIESGTLFAYDNSTDIYSPSRQFKAGFRFQTGNNSYGTTFDYYKAGINPTYIPNYLDTLAAILTSSAGTNTSQSISINSIPISSPSNSNIYLYNPTVAVGLSLGSARWDDEFSNAVVAEVMLTNATLNSQQKDRVDSYLSLKYGITRGNNSNTSATYNYFNSAGDVIFDKVTNIGFNNDIAGIGRDNSATGSSLLQKQSISVNKGEPVSIGLTTIASENTANTSTFTNDKSFLIWGNNGAITQSALNNSITFSQLPVGISARILRVWRAQATNFTQAVTVGFETSMLVNYTPLSNLVLLVSANATDWTNATIYNGATLNTGRVEFANVTIGNAKPFFTLATINYIATPLPVEMVSNTLTKEACTVKMNWTVASEKDCDYYFIEKSVDGTSWTNIGAVAGSGNSNRTINYSFTDRNAAENVTFYYRLTQVDYNGESTTYNPLSISGACLANDIAVFPNPTSERVTVQIPENAELNIFDNTLRLISSHSLTQGESEIQISHLAPALYILRFTMKNGETVVKSLMVK